MLGVGVKASEAADDAHAVLSRLREELQQLLGQLWRQGRHGQLGRGEVMVMHQLPAALQKLGNAREAKQEALYQQANVVNWTEKQSESKSANTDTTPEDKV